MALSISAQSKVTMLATSVRSCSQGARKSASTELRPAAAPKVAGAHCSRRRLAVARAAQVQTDQNVPEGHTSLHRALYGDGGAEEHDAGRTYSTRTAEDDGSTLVPIQQWLEDRDGEKPLGVYAVYNDQSSVEYIGYSRNMVTSIRGHLSRVPASSAAHVRAMVFNNKAMATREHLEREVASWVDRYAGSVLPHGNAQGRELWEGARALSDVEAAAHAEKAAKLKKAMGEGLGIGAKAAEAAQISAEQQRANMREAVTGSGSWSPVTDPNAPTAWQTATDSGNWSDEVARQTQEATSSAAATATAASSSSAAGVASGAAATAPKAAATAPKAAGASGTMVSPFAQPGVHRSIGGDGGGGAGGVWGGNGAGSAAGGGGKREMTVESVDSVLNEVRSYLIADGGDVEVVEVTQGNIYLRLQGSCSTCAASSATMKMGIERALKAAFGDDLKEVIQVDKQDVVSATVANVDLHLDMLRGAIGSLGGKVEVAEVANGKAVLKYQGPAAIGKGITAAVRDRFPEIREVVLQDFARTA